MGSGPLGVHWTPGPGQNLLKGRDLGEPRRLWIEGPAGRLEGMLRISSPSRGAVVVGHPHPLHGGTLHNPVVFHADRELNRDGWTTLRFNFRGVGASDGTHDEGRGELEDFSAAASWLRGLDPTAPLVAAGFSFGSWCAVRYAVAEPSVAAVIAIGLPVQIYPFDELARLARPLAVVQADRDEFGEPAQVEALLARSRLEPRIRIVAGTTHLFPGRAADAGAQVALAAAELVPG